MKILISSVTISDINSSYHKKKRNVLIEHGRILSIGTGMVKADQVIDARRMILSSGWFDMGTFVGDPGLEHKETLFSATKAATAGGFTELAMLPNTNPSIQFKNDIHYVTKDNDDRLVQIHPMASLTMDNQGKLMTEMIDLNEAGAVAFTDGIKPIWNTDILLKSLQYLQHFGGLLIDRPDDGWLSKDGHMNEGLYSATLGLRGIPSVAEDIATARDIKLLDYTGGRLHLSRMSSSGALELVREAKRKKKNITCDIASYQALFDDSIVETFDVNYKVNPPLRDKSDIQSIVKALRDDTIDILSSGHLPQNIESKAMEFDRAEFGMINLQTFASQLASLSKQVDIHQLITKITLMPRKILRLDVPVIEEDTPANLTLFDPTKKWLFNHEMNYSISSNSPWLGTEVEGKAVAVFNNSKYWIEK